MDKVLVTGGSGFIALHSSINFLKKDMLSEQQLDQKLELMKLRRQ